MATKRINTNSKIGLSKGNQEIISFIKYNDKSRQVYKVRCNYCLNEYESTIENFRDKRSSGQCCTKCSNEQNRNYNVLNASEAQISIVYSNYKSRAKLKNWDFSLTKEQFTDLVLQDCHYCGAKPNSFRQDRIKSERNMDCAFLLNGIDRKDSTQGYIESNVLPCCEDCNKAKRNLDYNTFINLIKSIHNNLKL